ncbi:MAG: Flp pilus assembly complex ATPase component TadA [Burkholderiaceae bacterium]|nr:Flp pilus assembly complex ATPase component TadA [Burkholderiaceae bacterium]
MLTLTVETDDGAARSLRIERFPARIGRRSDNAVHLPGWRVARVHAEIVRIEHGFKLVDRGSLGGTWVNGERIAEYAPLANDDEIEIAGYRMRVHPGSHGFAHDRVRETRGIAPGSLQAPGVVDVGGSAADGEVQRSPASAPIDGLVPWRRLLHRRLLATIDLRRQDIRQLSAEQLHTEIEALLRDIAHGERTLPEYIDRDRLAREVLDEAIGLGPLEPLLRDETISEIMVNAPDEIFVERNGRLEATGASFTGEDAVRAAIDRIVAPLGRRIDESSPMVDARLADGSRVNAVIPPLAVRGPAITIRRFNRRLFSPADLVANGSLSQPMLDFLAVCARSRRNVVVSGGTGSGKTTLLNLLSNLIEPGQRIVTIEDAAELRLAHAHRVTLEARPANAEGRGLVSIRDLVRNALRMRPDRIVVGECRGGEALDMLQAMNTGHDGSLTTVHANSPRDVVSRLETMVLMADVDMPVAAIREQIVGAIDVVVHQARMGDGRRRVVEIVELTGLEGARVLMQPLFRFAAGRFGGCGNVPQFYERLREEGEPLDLSIFRAGGMP